MKQGGEEASHHGQRRRPPPHRQARPSAPPGGLSATPRPQVGSQVSPAHHAGAGCGTQGGHLTSPSPRSRLLPAGYSHLDGRAASQPIAGCAGRRQRRAPRAGRARSRGAHRTHRAPGLAARGQISRRLASPTRSWTARARAQARRWSCLLPAGTCGLQTE